jgi:hypothetical protein
MIGPMRPHTHLSALLLAVMALLLCYPGAAAGDPADGKSSGEEYYFYRDVDYGSESSFNPVTSFVNTALDTLQILESFDDDDLDERFTEIWNNLRHPLEAIEAAGSYKDFINRQIFPIDPNNLEGSLEAVPNYALHFFGGGTGLPEERRVAESPRIPGTLADRRRPGSGRRDTPGNGREGLHHFG